MEQPIFTTSFLLYYAKDILLTRFAGSFKKWKLRNLHITLSLLIMAMKRITEISIHCADEFYTSGFPP